MSIVGYGLARLSLNLLYKIKLCISRLNLGQKHELFLEPFSYRECSLCHSRFPRSSSGRSRVFTKRNFQNAISGYPSYFLLHKLRLWELIHKKLELSEVMKTVNTLGRPFGPSRQLLLS